MSRGMLLATIAYLIWGFMGLYWVETKPIPAQDLVAHRVVWSMPVLVLCLLYLGHLKAALALFKKPRTLAILLCSALMQMTNWGIFLWAVTHEQATQASLGYFLLPLINVAIGLGLFGEKLDKAQLIAIALAVVGMVLLIIENKGLPWVALGVATSFGLYAAIRKAVAVEAVEGLFVEVMLMLPFALCWLWLQEGAGLAQFGLKVDLLLLGAGVVSVIPLICYVAASRLTALSSLGLVFYLGPSCQLFVAICVFGEPMNPVQLFSFALVWLGLAVVAADSLRRMRNMRTLSND
jgi:chloramphenicol-sensitive protein RarD